MVQVALRSKSVTSLVTFLSMIRWHEADCIPSGEIGIDAPKAFHFCEERLRVMLLADRLHTAHAVGNRATAAPDAHPIGSEILRKLRGVGPGIARAFPDPTHILDDFNGLRRDAVFFLDPVSCLHEDQETGFERGTEGDSFIDEFGFFRKSFQDFRAVVQEYPLQ